MLICSDAIIQEIYSGKSDKTFNPSPNYFAFTLKIRLLSNYVQQNI